MAQTGLHRPVGATDHRLRLPVSAGAVFAFTKDHVASPYLVSLNLALLSVSYIDQWRKDFRREIRAEEEKRAGP